MLEEDASVLFIAYEERGVKNGLGIAAHRWVLLYRVNHVVCSCRFQLEYSIYECCFVEVCSSCCFWYVICFTEWSRVCSHTIS